MRGGLISKAYVLYMPNSVLCRFEIKSTSDARVGKFFFSSVLSVDRPDSRRDPLNKIKYFSFLPEQLFWQETSVSPLFYMNIGETAVPGSLLKHPGTEDRKKSVRSCSSPRFSS